ncbi:MAG: hypothetical protein IT536_08325, partial [Hyphomicrobiales bacterium]|nr:hypothetical protein [Hyphomicrobiales bacterium]
EEVAFWHSENSTNPDQEVLRAVRPSMLTMPGSVLIGISSPYAKRGLLYEKFKKHFGKNDPRVLVWKAKTEIMNPQADADEIAKAYEDDPVAAAAEYGAEFRNDLEAFVSREVVDACISRGVRERSPVEGIRYKAFVDPAGGSGGGDSMTLAIGHMEKDIAVLDAVREFRPPFSPEVVVTEFAGLLKLYHISKIEGDRFASQWCQEPFRKLGIGYTPAEKPKSGLYVDLLPAINARKVDLLDNDRLVNQLCALERRTARGSGKDSIDHPPHAHDDLSNVLAGVVGMLLSRKSSYDSTYSWVRDYDSEEDDTYQLRSARFQYENSPIGRYLGRFR